MANTTFAPARVAGETIARFARLGSGEKLSRSQTADAMAIQRPMTQFSAIAPDCKVSLP